MDEDRLKEIEAKDIWDWDYHDIFWLIAKLKQSKKNEEAITRSREGYAQQNEALAEELEKCEADYIKLKGGKYFHDAHCSGNRNKPMGCPGCSCDMYKKVLKAEAEIKRLKK